MWVEKDLVEKTEIRNGKEKRIEESKLVAWDKKNKGAQTKETAT